MTDTPDTSAEAVERLALAIDLAAIDSLPRAAQELCLAGACLRAIAAENAALRAERERLALAICGGEDAPGYANSRTVEELEAVARKARREHGEDVDRLLRDQAENAALRARAEAAEAEEAEVERLREAVDALLIAARQADGREAHRIMPYIWPHIQTLAALTALTAPQPALSPTKEPRP